MIADGDLRRLPCVAERKARHIADPACHGGEGFWPRRIDVILLFGYHSPHFVNELNINMGRVGDMAA